MEANNKVTCPQCAYEFNIESVLASKIQAEYQKKLKQETRRVEVEAQKQAEAMLSEEVKKLEARALEHASKEVEKKLNYFKEDNEKKSKRLQELQAKEVEFLKKEQELSEKENNLRLQVEKDILEKQAEIEKKVLARATEQFALERRELEKKVEDNRKLAEEMQRKANQGSMQLQGEVQELELEELLAREFPFDDIDEVPKGTRGADCIQSVKNSYNTLCGTIVYESKRTKHFSNDWIDKLKKDMIDCNGDIAVLVTATLPKDTSHFYEEKGVWVCQFHEVKSLALILREMLIRVQAMKKSQENKGEKMELLYAYLSSSEFVNKVKALGENLQTMKDDLEKERKTFTKIWAEREKQIWASQESLIGVFGSINGISNNLVGDDDFLSLEQLKK